MMKQKNGLKSINLLKYLKENNIKYIILGGGSNVILGRSCFDVVIKLDKLKAANNDIICY